MEPGFNQINTDTIEQEEMASTLLPQAKALGWGDLGLIVSWLLVNPVTLERQLKSS